MVKLKDTFFVVVMILVLGVTISERIKYRRRKENSNGRFSKSRLPGKRKSIPISMREYVHKHESQATYCFQCAFSPDKDVYETKRVPVPVKDHYGQTRLVYKTKLMKVRRQGGWDKCVGPFDFSEANEYGIDVKACQTTCYARLETSGNIFRGCYKGAYGVDPYKYGCHEQQGSTWCFCRGQVCNNKEIVNGTIASYTVEYER